MKLAIEERDQVTLISVDGSLDAMTAPELGQALTSLIERGQFNLVADLGSLKYTSSAGIRVLLNAVKQARQNGGDLRMAAVQDDVSKVLKLAGLMNTFKQYKDADSAAASYAEAQ